MKQPCPLGGLGVERGHQIRPLSFFVVIAFIAIFAFIALIRSLHKNGARPWKINDPVGSKMDFV
jgi:hypothetical protein